MWSIETSVSPSQSHAPAPCCHGLDFCSIFLTVASVALVLITFPVSLCLCFKVSIRMDAQLYIIMEIISLALNMRIWGTGVGSLLRLFKSTSGPLSFVWVGCQKEEIKAQVM